MIQLGLNVLKPFRIRIGCIKVFAKDLLVYLLSIISLFKEKIH